ncbi:hypothetical protein KFK09_015474 [Dendrobium nobile]|uniref:CST complex subunit STN1 n=1 Tax=Dendrobium nobile TaxID=94219 RepID=A0A8T3B642_DENNO|nr:hypothetical protein KFK09_015474 [Dendrobium nobile]
MPCLIIGKDVTKQVNMYNRIHRAEFVGVVVSRDRRPKLLRFLIDDGSGCVPCVLWLNHDLLSKSSAFASGDDLAASAARDHAGKVHLGVLVRVRGRVTVFRGELQITVKDVLVERDPNAEILHWLQCIALNSHATVLICHWRP